MATVPVITQPDLYALLGVATTASSADIVAGARKAALRHHPDRAGGDRTTFLSVAYAKEVLLDPRRRRCYDDGGLAALKRDAEDLAEAGAGGSTDADSAAPTTTMLIFAIVTPFGIIYMTVPVNDPGPKSKPEAKPVAAPPPPPPPVPVKPKGPMFEAPIELTLEQIASGAECSVPIDRSRVDRVTAAVRQDATVLKFKPKSHWRTGSRILFVSEGDETLTHAAGDIEFVVSLRKHDVFALGDCGTLTTTVRLSIVDALCDCSVSIQHPDGSSFTVDCLAGATGHPGSRRTVPHRGLAYRAGADREGEILHGSLIIAFEVVWPKAPLAEPHRTALSKALAPFRALLAVSAADGDAPGAGAKRKRVDGSTSPAVTSGAPIYKKRDPAAGDTGIAAPPPAKLARR